MNSLFIFRGGSASGKTTLEEFLVSKGYLRYVTDTTRAPRKGEVNGVHYNFLSLKKFKKRKYANIIKITDEWLYGASEDELWNLAKAERDSVYSVINIEPAINIKRFIQKNKIPLNVYIIDFDIDQEFRVQLMKKRGESEKDILKRLQREEGLQDYSKFNEKPDFIVQDFFSSKDKVVEFIRVKYLETLEKEMDMVIDNSFEFKSKNRPIEQVIENLEKEGLWK